MKLDLYDVPKTAARVMLCCGWGMDNDDEDLNLVPDDIELIAAIKPTHVSIGINSIRAAEDHHRFVLTGAIKTHGERWAHALHKTGCTVGTHAWMVGSESFVRDAAEITADLAKKWGAGFDMPNPEEAWRGTTNKKALERHINRGRAKKAQMLKVAAKANHKHLGQLYVQELRGHGFEGDIWPAVVNAGPVAMRSMVEASTGACHQQMAFHNPRGHSTAKPPHRQRAVWRQIRGVWRLKDENHIKFGQHALYHQWLDKMPEVYACASVNAALSQARGMYEANASFWSLYWAKRQQWAARVVASYSPRHRIIGWEGV